MFFWYKYLEIFRKCAKYFRKIRNVLFYVGYEEVGRDDRGEPEEEGGEEDREDEEPDPALQIQVPAAGSRD